MKHAVLYTLIAWILAFFGCSRDAVEPKVNQKGPQAAQPQAPTVDDEDEDEPPSAAPAAPVASEWTPLPMTECRKFLTEKFWELDEFRTEDDFISVGFATNGPYHDWLLDVQRERNRKDSDGNFDERVAVGQLLMLGMEYAAKRGEDNEYTTFTRKEIISVIQSGRVR